MDQDHYNNMSNMATNLVQLNDTFQDHIRYTNEDANVQNEGLAEKLLNLKINMTYSFSNITLLNDTLNAKISQLEYNLTRTQQITAQKYRELANRTWTNISEINATVATIEANMNSTIATTADEVRGEMYNISNSTLISINTIQSDIANLMVG